jgi:hypothetical protein
MIYLTIETAHDAKVAAFQAETLIYQARLLNYTLAELAYNQSFVEYQNNARNYSAELLRYETTYNETAAAIKAYENELAAYNAQQIYLKEKAEYDIALVIYLSLVNQANNEITASQRRFILPSTSLTLIRSVI